MIWFWKAKIWSAISCEVALVDCNQLVYHATQHGARKHFPLLSVFFYFKQVVSGWPSEKLWARGAELHKRGGEGGKGRRTNSWHLRLLKYRPAHPLPVLLRDFAFNLLLSRESDAPSWTHSLSRFRVWGCSRQRSSCSWAPPPSWSPSPSRWRQPPLWSRKHPATLRFRF